MGKLTVIAAAAVIFRYLSVKHAQRLELVRLANRTPELSLCRTSLSSSEVNLMALLRWSKSEFEYGRKVLNSGLEGARSGQEAFLNGRPLTPFLSEVALNALKPAGIGACVAMLSRLPGGRRSSIRRVLGFGFVGSLIGFACGAVWQSRDLTASVAANARKNIGRVSDEHWLENNPIDYG